MPPLAPGGRGREWAYEAGRGASFTSMPATLSSSLRGALCALLLTLTTLVLSLALLPPALLKRLLPLASVTRACDRLLMNLAGRWVALNNLWMEAGGRCEHWDLRGLEQLHPQRWYLVASNHLGAVDILVLQRVLHGRIPFLKFFLKRELIWVPVIGLAWWALDFPFMRRGKTREAQRQDLDTARAACEKFRHLPTSVLNFVEGTRVTAEKRATERSPYRHLLTPKVGGLSVALATLGDQFEALLDITLVFPDGVPTFWDLLCGRLQHVIVHVRPRAIPSDLLGSDAAGERARMVRLGRWLQQIWREKDDLIDELLQEQQQPSQRVP